MRTVEADVVETTASERRGGRSLVVLDLAGALAFAGLAGWTVLAATSAGAGARSSLAAMAAAVGAYAGARIVAGISPVIVPLIVVGIGTAVFVTSPEEVLSSAPRVGPFGFSSITGAFFLQCAFGALMLVGGPWRGLAFVGVLATVVFGAVTLGTDTRAAVILLPVLGLPALLARRPAWSRRLIVGYGLLLALALGVAIGLGTSYGSLGSSGIVHEVIEATVTERRQALWHDALQIMREHPARGVGPGGFATNSPVAMSDPDEPWAHNEFLQAGADLGVPGMALLIGVFAWAFARLAVAGGRAPRGGRAAVIALGAAALAALGIHACIEYVLQRPAVPAVAAALLGTALGPFFVLGGRGGRLDRA